MAKRHWQPSDDSPHKGPSGPHAALRIIGGELRGRKLLYSGDERTRPMKDRVREAIFNLLGPAVEKTLVVDLFAGTGALGFEALSRGAATAVFIEQHFPTAALIRHNAALLGVASRCDVHAANVFLWVERNLPEPSDDPRWLVFCSPPYAFYSERRADVLALIARIMDQSPAGSTLVVESDRRMDLAQLPDAANWDTREYAPAVVSIHRK